MKNNTPHRSHLSRICRALALVGLLLAVLAGNHATAAPAGTAFTCQGRLNSAGVPANGVYVMDFALFNAASSGTQVGATLTNSAVAVTNGLFNVTLDFGTGIFPGGARWLEMGVTTNGGGTFTTLSPRLQLTPTPYAITANTASNLLGTLPSAQLSGTVGNAQLANNAITINAGPGLGGGGTVALGGSTP